MEVRLQSYIVLGSFIYIRLGPISTKASSEARYHFDVQVQKTETSEDASSQGLQRPSRCLRGSLGINMAYHVIAQLEWKFRASTTSTRKKTCGRGQAAIGLANATVETCFQIFYLQSYASSVLKLFIKVLHQTSNIAKAIFILLYINL